MPEREEREEDYIELDADTDIEIHDTNGHPGLVGFVFGFVCGALVAGAAVLVTAPAKGAVTRRRLRRRVEDIRDSAKDRLGDAADRLEHEKRRIRRRLKRK